MNEWFYDIWTTVLEEFSDLSDLKDWTRITLRLLVAAVLGALIGYDREARNRSAGLRTHMLVALGAAIFIITPMQSGMEIEDLSRVVQGIIAGIGFLGAGAILKLEHSERIHGLTTAASIWMTAAIGIAAGLGREMTATLSAVITLFVLSGLYGLESRMTARRAGEKRES
nr:MgtC/SapB family protein [uncultured Noviherbaspirillum sp.]